MRSTRASLTLLAAIGCLLFLLGKASPQGEPMTPVIIVYSPYTPDWGNRLADLIRGDPRFGADVQIVGDRLTLETLVNLPRVQAVVLCPLTRPQVALEDISNMMVAYFQEGGAVVGMGTVCTSSYCRRVGPEVFSISGNRSISAQIVGGRRVFTYCKADVIPEINGGMPNETLLMEGYLAFFSSNADGMYVPIPANGTRHVLYESETHVPLVVAFEPDKGGASVAFPGLSVQETPGKENYYGYLLEREEFRQLFLNSLKWAMDNGPRFQNLKETAAARMEAESTRRADLAAEADRLQKKVEGRRLMRLAIVWVIGLAFCAGVAVKLVIVRERKG